eukprot:GHVR01020470.1.p1 GENE.GHVR01020470.1~~GHVR01020470.1.p1  ORF type:complete len:192 (+),score=51.85 GHVR01020470.1:229-804(+)
MHPSSPSGESKVSINESTNQSTKKSTFHPTTTTPPTTPPVNKTTTKINTTDNNNTVTIGETKGVSRRGTRSTTALDPTTAYRLRGFVKRNSDALKRELINLEKLQQDINLDVANIDKSGHTHDSSSIEAYDVFSPDTRSLRWIELQEVLLSDEGKEFNKFKETVQSKRGVNKALTMAGCLHADEGKLPLLH